MTVLQGWVKQGRRKKSTPGSKDMLVPPPPPTCLYCTPACPQLMTCPSVSVHAFTRTPPLPCPPLMLCMPSHARLLSPALPSLSEVRLQVIRPKDLGNFDELEQGGGRERGGCCAGWTQQQSRRASPHTLTWS